MKPAILLALLCFAGLLIAVNSTANFTNAANGSAMAPAPAAPQWTANCSFSIERTISGTRWGTTITSVITNDGGASCSPKNLIFEDYIPPEFGEPWKISYSPQFVRMQNRSVRFLFAGISPGEKKTIVYGVPLYVSDLQMGTFGSGLLYPVNEENESARQALAPIGHSSVNPQSVYDATVAIVAVGVFIILSAGIGLIWYFEKKKKERGNSDGGKNEE